MWLLLRWTWTSKGKGGKGVSDDFLSIFNDLNFFFLAKRGRRPRVAGIIILSLKGLRRDEISCGVYGHIYL